jgi:hypothetical protein
MIAGIRSWLMQYRVVRFACAILLDVLHIVVYVALAVIGFCTVVYVCMQVGRWVCSPLDGHRLPDTLQTDIILFMSGASALCVSAVVLFIIAAWLHYKWQCSEAPGASKKVRSK